jgi:hypothetical protein
VIVRSLWSARRGHGSRTARRARRLALLRVHGSSAEYWDAPGGRIATVLSFVRAKVTGDRLDVANETVDLR